MKAQISYDLSDLRQETDLHTKFYIGYLGPYTLFFCFKRNYFVSLNIGKNLRKYSENSQSVTVTKAT